MSPVAARCALVGAAVLLLVAALVVPVAGALRAVLLGAAGCCAVLDVLVVRAGTARLTRGRHHEVDEVVLAPTSAVLDLPAVDDDAGGAADGRPVVLGTTPDGRVVSVDARSRPHILVIGSGALALAVFRAVAAQVRAAAGPDDDVRVASSADARALVGAGTGRCPPMPSGTAAIVVGPADRAHGDGTCTRDERAIGSTPPGTGATAVLVPGLSIVPRLWDVAVEVTRHGCTVRFPHDARGTVVVPALPRLGGPP